MLCEKPLANSVAEAERMAAAAPRRRSEGVFAMCGFTYRRTPALALAEAAGRRRAGSGTIRHVRAQYLQDWLSDADAPLTWRLDKSKSGSGALGDIGAHSIDAAQWITGQKITGVSALLETFVTSGPWPATSSAWAATATPPTTPRAVPSPWTTPPCSPRRFDGGAIGVFEATRFALGRKNACGWSSTAPRARWPSTSRT